MDEIRKTVFFMNQMEKWGYSDEWIGYLLRHYPIDPLLDQYDLAL